MFNVAILETNATIKNKLETCISNYKDIQSKDWSICFFQHFNEFNASDDRKFGAIFVKYHPGDYKFTERIQTIKLTCSAPIALLCHQCSHIPESIMENKNIETIIDIQKIDEIIKWIEYIEAQTWIKKAYNETENMYNNFCNMVKKLVH